VLALLIVLLGTSDQLDDYRAKFRSLSVPSGMLDYGEKGKILKQLALVYGVRVADAPPAPNPKGRIYPEHSLFAKDGR